MLVPEEEAPPEEDLNGDAMVKDEGRFCSDAGVSSTVVPLELIPIPTPVRASVRTQKAIKGHGTKDCPYDLDFVPSGDPLLLRSIHISPGISTPPLSLSTIDSCREALT